MNPRARRLRRQRRKDRKLGYDVCEICNKKYAVRGSPVYPVRLQPIHKHIHALCSERCWKIRRGYIPRGYWMFKNVPTTITYG